jgi:hypothetical protein
MHELKNVWDQRLWDDNSWRLPDFSQDEDPVFVDANTLYGLASSFLDVADCCCARLPCVRFIGS